MVSSDSEVEYAVIYARRSGHGENSRSIPDQIRECLATPEARPYGDHVHIIKDEAISGANPNRPGLAELRAKLADPACKAAIFYHQDRLAREDELNAVLGRLFKGRPDVIVRSVMQGVLTFNASGVFMWTIQGAFAAYYRAQVSERMLASYRGRRAAGGWTGNRAPMGYSFTGRSGEIVPDENADLVRRIYRMAIDGMRLTDVAAILNAENAPLPVFRGDSDGKVWTLRHVRGVIVNRAYIAETPDGDPASWEPLVSVATYQAAQARLQMHRTARTGKWESSLRGYVRCSCGRLLKWQKPKATVRGYCASRASSTPCPDSGHGIHEDTVLAWLDGLAEGWKRQGFKLSHLLAHRENVAAAVRAEIATLDGRIARIDDRLDLGLVTLDEAKRQLVEFRRQRQTLEAQLAETGDTDDDLDTWPKQWRAAGPSERRALVGQIFESITVDRDGEVVDFTPRRDRRAGNIRLLVATALDDGSGEPDDWTPNTEGH